MSSIGAAIQRRTSRPYVNYYHFLCPSHEEVRDHLAKIFGNIANTANLDGVHLDYIRYPDVILPVALWKKYNLVPERGVAAIRFLLLRGLPERVQEADRGRPTQNDGPHRQRRMAAISLRQRH
jgi:hypothetical protein